MCYERSWRGVFNARDEEKEEDAMLPAVVQGDWLTVPCPKCKTGHVAFFPKVAKCDNAGCGLLVFRGVAGRELTDSHSETGIHSGRCPFMEQNGCGTVSFGYETARSIAGIVAK